MSNYKSWDVYTQIDYISLFIKTYLAFISTVRSITGKEIESKAMDCYMGHFAFKQKLDFTDTKDFSNIKNLYSLSKKIFALIKVEEDYLFSNFYKINENFYDTISRSIKFKHSGKNAKIDGVFSVIYRNDNLECKFKSEKVIFIASGKEFEFNDSKEFKIKKEDIMKEKIYINTNFLNYLNTKNFYDDFALDFNGNNVKIFLEQEMLKYLENNFDTIFPQKPFNKFDSITSFNQTEQYKVKTWIAEILRDMRNLVLHAYINPLDEQTKELYKNGYNLLRKILENNIDYLESNSQKNANT